MFNRIYTRFINWFTAPDSPIPLGWFRVAVALFCIVKTVIIRQSFEDIYGQYGFVQWAITRATLYDGLPHVGDLTLLLGRMGLSPDQSVHLLLGIYLFVLCGLLVGWNTRWMAVGAWFINYLWMHAGGGLVYGMDIFTHIALFYCMIMPVGDYLSLDVYTGKRQSHSSTAAGISRKMLQLHMCIVYFSSGLEKASGSQWWNGEAIWRSVMLPVFHQFDMGWMAHVPWLPMMIGWSVLAIEIGYAFFIWSRRTRLIWLVITAGMHFFIGVFLGMWLFGSIMIILNLGAFLYDALRDNSWSLNLLRLPMTASTESVE